MYIYNILYNKYTSVYSIYVMSYNIFKLKISFYPGTGTFAVWPVI